MQNIFFLMIQDLLSKNNTIKNSNKRFFSFFKGSIFRQILKYLRYLIIAALLAIAVYGCAQQFLDPNVRTYPSPGAGFEIVGKNETDGFNTHVVINGNYEINYNKVVTFASAWRLGPFYGLFVWPIAQLAIAMLTGISTSGWGVVLSIFFLVLVIRTFVLLLTFNQIRQQLKMQLLQTKIAEIRGKYPDNKKDNLQRQKMQLDLMRFYKKNNVRPIGSIIGSIATLPFFYAIYRVVASLRYVKEATLGPFSMSITPISAIFGGNLVYIVIALMVIATQVVAFKLPAWLNKTKRKQKLLDAAAKKQMKTTNMITIVMIVVFAIIAVSVPTALCFYWAFSALFTAGQNYIMFWFQNNRQRFKRFQRKQTIEEQLVSI